MDVLTAGHEKTKVSFAACANAAGDKLPLMVLLPRKTKLKDFTPPSNVVVVYDTKATFDSYMVCTWFDRVLAPHTLSRGITKSVLVFDQAPPHNTALVADKARERGVRLIKVPKRMTGLLQPAHTHWFAVMKRAYRTKWNHWYAEGLRTYTKAGNIRSPSYKMIITWLSEIWQDLDPELIFNSFD